MVSSGPVGELALEKEVWPWPLSSALQAQVFLWPASSLPQTSGYQPF